MAFIWILGFFCVTVVQNNERITFQQYSTDLNLSDETHHV